TELGSARGARLFEEAQSPVSQPSPTQKPGFRRNRRRNVPVARQHSRHELGSAANRRARELCEVLEMRSGREWIDRCPVRWPVLSEVGEHVGERMPNGSRGGEGAPVPALVPKLSLCEIAAG